jgi:phage terminase large subunit
MLIEIPDRLEFLFKPKRFKILYGGRGGYKTKNICRALTFRSAKEKTKIMCLREFQASIEDSVHAAIKTELDETGIGSILIEKQPLFEIYETKIDARNGSQFRYYSFSRHLSAIKGNDDCDIAWIEEGESISHKDLNHILIPTMRKDGSEIWISFNPDDEFGAVYSQFVKPHLDEINSKGFYEDDLMYVIRTSIDDNPFPNQLLLEDSERLKKSNYREWLHVYGGEPYLDYENSIIKPEWVDAAIDSHLKLKFSAIGVRSLGFDLADTGDAKVTMQRHGSVITNGDRWTSGELPDAIDRAFRNAEEWKSEFMVYDDDGLGKSMKVYVANVTINKNILVVPYNGNDSVDDPDDVYLEDPAGEGKEKTNQEMFRNKRAQYYWYLRDRFEATYNAINKGIYTDPEELISISSDLEDLDILKSELIKIKRVRGNNSMIQIQSKKDAAKEGTKSPNMADGLIMCFANPLPIISAVQVKLNIKPMSFY